MAPPWLPGPYKFPCAARDPNSSTGTPVERFVHRLINSLHGSTAGLRSVPARNTDLPYDGTVGRAFRSRS
jgi:hypothetical protein